MSSAKPLPFLRKLFPSMNNENVSVTNADKKFDLLFKNSFDAVVVVDDKGNFIDANPQAVALFGDNKEVLLQKNMAEYVITTDEQTAGWQLLSSESMQVGVFELHTGGGNTRDIEFTTIPDAVPNQHIAILHDISRRRVVAETVRKSEEQYQLLFKSMIQGVIYVNNQGKITSANEAAEEILGVPLESMLDKTPALLGIEAIQENGETFSWNQFPGIVSLQKNEEVKNVLIGITLPEGKRHKWINMHAVPQYLPNETKPYSAFTTLEDITERKHVEDELKKRTQELEMTQATIEAEKARDEAILDSIGDAMIATDSERKIVLLNKAAEELVGWKTNEVLAKSISEFLHVLDKKGNELPVMDRPLHAALQGKKIIKKNYFYINRDGKKIPANVTATPIILNGTIIGTIEILRDITREKEIDRMKTEFISLASHQLRTPLSAIRWFTEMLIDGDAGKLRPEQQEFVENISKSTGHMIELVNSLLNISRIESGRLIVDPTPTDLRQLVSEIVTELKAKLEEKNQKIIISMHDQLPIINVDARLIRQVYMNLLTNAIKYSPENTEITIIISKNGQEVVNQITDEGYGILDDEKHKVFDKFFRGENISKIITEGTGLGLYLVKAIVDSSNGRIWFDSIEGKGTTFWFTLPLSGMKPHEGEVSLEGQSV